MPRDGVTTGEVVMRGNIVMKGYYGRPEATADAFRGGWFHSGDAAVWHPDGLIELRDRTKDIVISGGENISTIEVEQVIAPPSGGARVRGRVDAGRLWGERPKAYVTLQPGAEATAEELIEFCRGASRASSARRGRGLRQRAELDRVGRLVARDALAAVRDQLLGRSPPRPRAA